MSENIPASQPIPPIPAPNEDYPIIIPSKPTDPAIPVIEPNVQVPLQSLKN